MSDLPERSKEQKMAWLERTAQEPDYTAGEPVMLQRLLDDPEAEVRELAAKAFWEYPESLYIPLLCDVAQDDPEAQVRCQAIRTLGRYVYEGRMADYDYDSGPMAEVLRTEELPREDSEKVKAFLVATYRDESKPLDERRFAVEALSFSSEDEVIAIIEEAYARPETSMKLSAIFAMGRNGKARWTDILCEELYNPDPKLQREAIWSIGEAGTTGAGKDLWRLTYADDRDTQLMAIWALGKSGWEGAFDRLDELSLDSSDPEVQEAAEDALEEWYLYSGQLVDDASDLDSLDLV